MAKNSKMMKKRVLLTSGIISICLVVLIGKLALIEIVNAEFYQKKALEQWIKDIPIPSARGVIYDRNGKKLAVSATAYSLNARPLQIEDKELAAKIISETLNMDIAVVTKKLNESKSSVSIKQKIDSDLANKLREELLNNEIKGFEFIDDSKRYYPQANFASHVLGFTNIDNVGQDGVEASYNKELSGEPGRQVVMTDNINQELPGSDRRYFEPVDGNSIVLTIDEVIQHFAEKAAETAYIDNKAKAVSILVMDPKTGDVLAMVNKPDYDNNNPRVAPPGLESSWSTMTNEQQLNELYKTWRNPIISDAYEPGSTFKTIVTAAALEEGLTHKNDKFNCAGYTMVAGKKIKCWRSYRPHGVETLAQGLQNSCNPVFIELSQRLGEEKFLKYIKTFGFGAPTNIELKGEGTGIVRTAEQVGPVELTNIGFGQGIAVTRIQLLTAICAIANDGYLMQPRIVKQVLDAEGKVLEEIEPVTVRQVISKQTSATMREMMESVVSEGGGGGAYIPGYKVAGKTGTAEKVVNGGYGEGRIASFISFAPANDPRVAVLVVIDEPNGPSKFGGVIAAPVGKAVLTDTLRYLDVKPQYTPEEAAQFEKPLVKVPEIRNMKLKDAQALLKKNNLKLVIGGENETGPDSLILDQTPKVGAEVYGGTNIVVYAQDS